MYVCMWNLGSCTKSRTQIEGVCEQCAENNWKPINKQKYELKFSIMYDVEVNYESILNDTAN